jgi:hypothetical protein
LNEDTVCSWSSRYDWKLPKRNGGGSSQAITSQASVGDALLADHKELEERGKSAIARASVKCAEVNEALPLPDAQSLSQLANALGRVFQWSTGQGNTVNVHADKAVIVCDEGRRAELIAQRQRLLGEKPAKASEV